MPTKATPSQKGTLTLDGEEALIYSRIRKEDPRGDFGRQMRQRQVIQAIHEQRGQPVIISQLSRNICSTWQQC